MAFFSKKTNIILVAIIAFFVILRLLLPSILLRVTNKALSEIEDYSGKVGGLDVALLRGGFTIHNLIIEKDSTNIPVPFLEVKTLDLSIHWKALLQGSLVGEVIASNPIFNFAIDSTGQESQTGVENNWVETLKEVTPIDINLNLVTINNAQINYKDFSQHPMVDVYFKSFNLQATNLSNVVNTKEKLPATIKAQGISIGEGKLNITASANILKPIPDFNADFKLEHSDLTSINTFTEAYANFDFEEGDFSLYSEVVMENGSYDGYLKPVLKDLNLIKKGSDKNKSILNKGYQLLLDEIFELFENQKKNSFATKSPVSGNVNETDVGIIATISSAFKNAFIKAIPEKVDNDL